MCTRSGKIRSGPQTFRLSLLSLELLMLILGYIKKILDRNPNKDSSPGTVIHRD